ncbi:Protein ripply [Acropora cervicornis]|uniref:Protein ripply n=1 Tax=Acropora cervicornis TaxID=6130 RepID=A0AAD9R0M9_ACRCE|nr:Protein ripply [Acropora cervicornis]
MIYMLKREITKAKFKFISFVSSKYAFAMFSSRLLWTKAVFDYMYASGETLLRNFPVQATIQVVDWSSDEEEGEEDSWEHNEEEEESAISCEQESKKSSSQGETKKRNFQEI